MDAEHVGEPAALSLLGEYANTHHETTENGAYGVYSVLDLDGHLYAGYGTRLFRFTDDPVADELGAQAPLAVTGTVEMKTTSPQIAATVSRFLGINMTYDVHRRRDARCGRRHLPRPSGVDRAPAR